MRKQEEEKVLNFHLDGYQFSSLMLSEVLKIGKLNIQSFFTFSKWLMQLEESKSDNHFNKVIT